MKEQFSSYCHYDSPEDLFDFIDSLSEKDLEEFKKVFPEIFKTFEILKYYESVFKLQIEDVARENR